MRVGVLASGRGSNLQALLDAQAAGSLAAHIVVVASDKSEAPALERARAAGVPAVFVDPGGDDPRLTPAAEGAFLETLGTHEVEWLVLAGFFRIVGPKLLEAFSDRIINIHPSLLPSFKGLNAQTRAWERGVKIAGCTVHLVREKVDAGPILDQAAVRVEPSDGPDGLAAKILVEEHKLLVAVVNRIAREGFRLEDKIVHWGSSAA